MLGVLLVVVGVALIAAGVWQLRLRSQVRVWTDITPEQAVAEQLNLAERTDIVAPVNEQGERCPWPWEPQQLVGVPLGQYHCPYCGAMVIAGVPHIDYGAPDRASTDPH